MTRVHLTTTIPYVNAAPHLGFALEAVQADVLARHYRRRGACVRLQSGTDDNSLKNVLAAQAAGLAVQDLVDRNAAAFAALQGELNFSYDDFVRTSRDPRHRAAVDRVWRACAAADDLYRAVYEGLYCLGCEHYLTPDELDAAGCCPEHAVPPQRLSERNWFFRLSRYTEPLRAAITCGRLRIEPAARRNEVLSFLSAGLRDFSVSRSRQRARGWGIPVPGDPDQVIYVWYDALANYLCEPDWWTAAARRVHVVGKGVLRFHAVYWPAILLSAGLPLPTEIFVHDYLTVDGRRISKSSGTSVDPAELTGRFGVDAVRWWLLREVPRVGDTDFTVARLVNRANDDLAGGVGNLVQRVVTLIHRYRDGRATAAPQIPGPPGPPGPDGPDGPGRRGEAGQPTEAAQPTDPAQPTDAGLRRACHEAPGLVAAALDDFDFRRATTALWTIVEAANRYLERVRPWELARATDPTSQQRLDRSLADLLYACRALARELAVFLPDAAERVARQCTPVNGRLPEPRALFQRAVLPERARG
jgi:methionyl-tRNA synthetase